MRIRQVDSLLVAIFLCFGATGAQATTQSDPQAVALAAQALSALVGTNVVTDVTLAGTATRIVGCDNETGTATLKALVPYYSRLDLSFPSGTRSEIRGILQGGPGGNWIGPDGVIHEIVQKFLNNGLALDLQFQTVAINTGLTASAFALQ